MDSTILLFVSLIASVVSLPAPQSFGTAGLGEQCSTSADCAKGAACYAVNSMLIKICGNFQASCTSNDQCAFNTCVNGFCNGFIPITATSSSVQSCSTSTTVYNPLGADCNPNLTPCANGANCYATNSMLQPRCGNFQASCTSDAQCAFNTCNGGLCNGFIPTTSSATSIPTN